MNAAQAPSASSPGPTRAEALLLWAGLLAAFSPVVVDLARHLAAHPWALYTAVFPVLFARCALAEPERPAIRRSGTLWIAAGTVFEIVGIGAAAVRIGRVGLLLAAVGLCRRFGFASGRTLVLLVLAVPLPSAVLAWTTPAAQGALLAGASGILGSLGPEVTSAGLEARIGARTLVLEPVDGGIALAVLLAGLSWYRSLMLRTPLRAAVGRAAAAAVLAIPVQLAAVTLALAALPWGGEPGLLRLALSSAPWLAVTTVSVVRTELQIRQRKEAGP